MIDEIVCPDCTRIFYDWADADEHVCLKVPEISEGPDVTPEVATMTIISKV